MAASLVARTGAAGLARTGARGLRGGRPSAGGHHPDDPHYLHAKNMYEIWNIPSRKLYFGAMTLAVVGAGFGIPFAAVEFSQWKTKTG